MTSPHEEIRELLPEHLAGRLDNRLSAMVLEHLEACEDCRAELTLLSQMASEPIPDPGDLFWMTLPGRVAAEAAGTRPRKPGWMQWLLNPAALTATAALVAVAAFFALQTAAPPPMVALKGEAPRIADAPVTVHPPEKRSQDTKEPATVASNDSEDAGDAEARMLGVELFAALDDPLGESPYSDLSSLNDKELEGLYRALKQAEPLGG